MFFASLRPFSQYRAHWVNVYTKIDLHFRNAESDRVVAAQAGAPLFPRALVVRSAAPFEKAVVKIDVISLDQLLVRLARRRARTATAAVR